MRLIHFIISMVVASVVVPGLVLAQDRMARPNEPQRVQPGRPGSPQVQPPRPGHIGPQIQPPRPSSGRPQIQPPRPSSGRPQIQPPRPGPTRPRPPHNNHRPDFHRPPHYRPPSYQYPHGYGHYRHWRIGAVLPAIFFRSQYYFRDYSAFGLYAPPAPYRWVRYGPDLILVNTRTGHIREVHYAAFG